MKAEKPKKFQVIGLIGRSRMEKHADFLKKLKSHLKRCNCEVMWDDHLDFIFGASNLQERKHILKTADLVITLGGDGTVLKAVRDLPKRKDLYLFGVNLGNLGFHTEVEKKKALEVLDDIFKNQYHIDERSLLRMTIYRKGKKIATHLALNDIVINQGNFARLISLRAEIDKRKMIDFKADGLIIATPTGSTGHSLSAGGPIVHPQIDAFVFTPICPSDLSVRPVIFPSGRQLTVTIDTDRRFEDNKIGLTIDGQIVVPVEYGDQVKIRKSTRKLRFIRKSNAVGSYYKILRDKLSWGKKA